MLNSNATHIPSGSFRTSRQSNVLFQAYLGTCVGIALFDHHAHIGGMIHILLPEPVGTSSPENPEKYASTGLPLLIEELYSMGAKPSTMVATVAGGALVGPVSHQDINLDIGGRSTEIAIEILCKEGIVIKKSETGGFFTCTLELNLNNGETIIRPAWDYKAHTSMEAEALSKEDIYRTIDSLTPIPQTALKILRIVQQNSYTIESILYELKKDQVLAARTIQMCNSAMFGGKIKIDTLKDALLILGESALINSVITAVIRNYFGQSDANGYSLCKGGMFFHSVGCAVTAEIIAVMTGRINPQTAYTAGLLHDIGKVVLDQHIAKFSPLFFRELHHKKTDYLTVEDKILGINHCETGSMLAAKWNFSNALTDVVLYHHCPQKSHDDNTELVSHVYIADLLMSRFNTGLETDKMKSENLKEILSNVGLSIADLSEIVDSIPLYIFDLNR
ncbi:MAG: HDOD domain-containing protein [Desulfamplus sp.]|nr:HDOD domain-containing protein [Desulfamplus sp.]